MTFKFPSLVAKCDVCGRCSTETSVGTKCKMPQPDGGKCLGLFVDVRKTKQDTSDSSTAQQEEDAARIVFTFAGMPVGIGTVLRLPKPKPKVVLSDRAKAQAQRAFWDCPHPSSKESLNAALEAVAGIIVADNLAVIATGTEASADLLRMFGRAGDAAMCETYVAMLRDYIETLDPNRP